MPRLNVTIPVPLGIPSPFLCIYIIMTVEEAEKKFKRGDLCLYRNRWRAVVLGVCQADTGEALIDVRRELSWGSRVQFVRPSELRPCHDR